MRGPDRSVSPRSRRRAEKRAAKGGDFAGELLAAETQTAPVSTAGPLTAVDAVLALQEVPDATGRRGRALERGTTMLERLDDIRHGLLLGAIPREKLNALVQMVQGQREHADDPRLTAILDEIELRAAVEGPSSVSRRKPSNSQLQQGFLASVKSRQAASSSPCRRGILFHISQARWPLAVVEPADASRLPRAYRPKKSEPFMNARQHEYFRRKLVNWRTAVVHESGATLRSLKEGDPSEPDLGDRAHVESSRRIELRTRERARKLVCKIDSALTRLATGTYGYCEETGDAIGLSRLEARPIATLSVEAQERHERRERSHRGNA